MKHFIFIVVLSAFTQIINAQESILPKQYFQEAKLQLESMLNGKEKPNYEKAIYIIENAWYSNKVDKQNFEHVMNHHIKVIQKMINNSYNEKDITQRPSLLISQQEIIQQYKQALANYAIYNYITNTTISFDSNNIFYHQPYQYSYTDPMASNNWENTQVINLNNTKQGNCFAMASLFKIFSDRLNSEANLCTAPSHIYIRHKDDKGTKYNIELGSKHFPGTGMINAVTYTTNQAIQNGIAHRELNTTQAVALCLVYLAKGYQHKFNNTSDEFILQCAETALQYDNKNLNAQLLKAEYLENKLIAQCKTIPQLQTQPDFKEYQNLITQLYNQGYREMPLEMKNTLLKIYNKEKINPTTKHLESVSISFGLFDERHTTKPTERIGNTLFNTKTKKITTFTKDQILYNNYNFDPVTFAWNIDPLFKKYPSLSPYAFCGNSPIMYKDLDGRKLTIHYKDKNGDDQAYVYGSKLEVPDDPFVKAVISDLDKISSSKSQGAKLERMKKTTEFNYNIYQSSKTEAHAQVSPSSNGKDHIPATEQDIDYNPTMGLQSKEGKGFLLPFVALWHELGHEYSATFTPNKFVERSRNKYAEGSVNEHWQKEEEKYNIENFENPLAKENDMYIRTSHDLSDTEIFYGAPRIEVPKENEKLSPADIPTIR